MQQLTYLMQPYFVYMRLLPSWQLTQYSRILCIPYLEYRYIYSRLHKYGRILYIYCRTFVLGVYIEYLCLLNFLGSSRTLGVVSRLA
jgi:hypothetical protein